MIRIPVTPQELEALIEKEAPGWLERAATRTRQARKQKRFTGEGIWSEVKGVYMALQRHKCAYCERPMAENPHAKIEYDVEHFRPKSRVTPWPDEETAKALRIKYKVRSGAPKGYPQLAHNPHNYVVTCKVCNSPLKADHFPIEGTPSMKGDDVATLAAEEKPLLLYPLGMASPAPEDLITFEGVLPVPARRAGHDRKRAQVPIDFFRLHLRTELRDARAHLFRTVRRRRHTPALSDGGAGVRSRESRTAWEPLLRCSFGTHIAVFQNPRERMENGIETGLRRLKCAPFHANAWK